jgi:5-methylcytosine-specific restriction endonuclease McrA
MHLRQKQPRFKLNPEEYTAVQNQVLKRDGWRCQDCGAMKDLQVHHMKPRSRLGGDVKQNLITLCAGCHGKRHGWAGSEKRQDSTFA